MSESSAGNGVRRSDAETERKVQSVVRTFLGMTLCWGSAALGVAQLTVLRLENFVLSNQGAIRPRLIAVGVCWLFGAMNALGWLLVSRRAPDAEGARRDGLTFSAPLIVGAFLPALGYRSAWEGREAALLCYVLALALVIERTLSPALLRWRETAWGERFLVRTQSDRVRRVGCWVAWLVLVVLVGGYVARVGYLTNVGHIKLATSSSDLAEYDNMFFNALHGHPFRAPAIAGHLKDWNTLQGHAEFGLYLLLPFYAIAPSAKALLWIQTVLVGSTAIPLFLFGRRLVGVTGALVFAFAYLAMPAVQQPNFYDFHFTPLGMFFVAWLLFFASVLAQGSTARGARIGYFVVLGLALLCREDVSIGIAAMALYLVLSGRLVRIGLITFALASVYFVLMKFVVMPQFGTWWFDNMYDDLKAPGAKGFGAVVITLLSNPAFVLRSAMIDAKFLYALHMTVPMAALWIRRPLLWLVILPGLVATWLVTNRPPMFQASFQYTYFWVPYVVAASMVAVRRDGARAATLAALLVSALALSYQKGVFPCGERIQGGFVNRSFELSAADIERNRQLESLVAKIPVSATVSATEAEGPHVSSRLIMYSLKYTLGPMPDYLLIGGAHIRSEVEHLKQALETNQYGVVAQEGPFLLLRKGADSSTNEVAWRRAGVRRRR